MHSGRSGNTGRCLLLALGVVAGACATPAEHPDAQRACELLQVERAFAAPPPSTGSWADQDARVQEVVDIRQVAGPVFAAIARRFDGELAELADVTGGGARAAFERLRSADDQSLDDIVATYRAVEELVAEECG